jgi:Lar family restriction alleviation protein
MTNLKPCPFCGASNDDDLLGFTTTPYAEAVMCRVCQMHGPLSFEEHEAIAAWNRRAKETTTIQQGKSAKSRHTRQEKGEK